jgi:serine/threonine protein kinase, bacterial
LINVIAMAALEKSSRMTVRDVSVGSGAIFAGYTILRRLGSGGMGEVYLAQHPRLPRRDALKMLPEEISADSEFRRRFDREADLAATLWHPNIVGVHDRGEFDGRLWIAMDYVEGADASQMMNDRYLDGMPAPDVCAIVTAAAGALDYAHQRGVLHRDVKPANILLTEPEDGERRILLADFGIARQVAEVSGLTATNMTVGTVTYAAPEQLMGAEIDGRADQYALAATAFHLLTGSPPCQHSDPIAVISQHLNAAPPKLGDHRADLATLDETLSTALAKDPEERFLRCRDFANAFSERVTGASTSSRPSDAEATVASPVNGHPTASPDSATTPSRIRPAVVIAAAVAVMVIGSLTFVGIELSRTRHTAAPPTSTSVAPTPATTSTPTPPLSAIPPPPPPPTATTTPTTTTPAAASGPALGETCSDYDKLAYDRNTGNEIVCGANTSPATHLQWVDASGLPRAAQIAGTPCPGAPQGWSYRSTDGYMIICQATDDGTAYEPGGVKLTGVQGPIWQLYSP